MKKTKKVKGFTYVEMLIVLGLIAFLFSILVPALIRAKEMAKKIYCVNNLNQTMKVTVMYNMDNGQTPYSSTWLVDFAFMGKYIDTARYKVMECPDTTDVVDSVDVLTGGTSYHYMGSRYDWEKNNIASGDGTEYGFDATNPSIMSKLSDREEKVVYDKSDTVHYGSFNVVKIESGHYESVKYSDRSDYWFLTPAGTLNFDDEDLPDRSDNLNQERLGDRFLDAESSDSDDDAEASEEDEDDKNKVTIVHYPPGNPENPQIISISQSAWPAHEAHGDEMYTGQSVVSTGSDGSGTATDTSTTTTTDTSSTSDTDDKAKNNNGHGNNEDGVDSSNPGKSKEGEDTDPTVDDEKKKK